MHMMACWPVHGGSTMAPSGRVHRVPCSRPPAGSLARPASPPISRQRAAARAVPSSKQLPVQRGPLPVRAAQQQASDDPSGLAGLFMQYAAQMQQAMLQQRAAEDTSGANVLLSNVGFHPPGADKPLLAGVNMALPANKLGLIIGRSGSGKTTLLQLLAGLTEQTEGDVVISPQPLVWAAGGGGSGEAGGARVTLPGAAPAQMEQRMQQVGLVFQFPERHFLGDDLVTELTFAWPRDLQYWAERQALGVRMQQVINAVGLGDIPLNTPPTALSGGQQRRLALALQLARSPSLMLLDEPLAGLDWRARAEVVALLRQLKTSCTLLVVSHDLREIEPLVDCAWRMHLGGRLEEVAWPPDSLSELEN